MQNKYFILTNIYSFRFKIIIILGFVHILNRVNKTSIQAKKNKKKNKNKNSNRVNKDKYLN